MSKRNMLLGNAAGKVGDLVFYRAGGEQRTRTRVTPNNPRSYDQQAQRSKMAQIALVHRALSALIKDSFPSRPSKQSAFNAFSAANIAIAPYLTKDNAAIGNFLPMPAFVAKGGLPASFTGIEFTGSGGALTLEITGITTASTAPTTVAQLSAILKAWRPCCFANGTKLIIALVEWGLSATQQGGVARYIKVTIDDSDSTTLSSLGISATKTGSDLKLSASSAATMAMGGVVILTQDENGKWDSNAAQMVLDSGADTRYNLGTSASAKEAAAESYGASAGSCFV